MSVPYDVTQPNYDSFPPNKFTIPADKLNQYRALGLFRSVAEKKQVDDCKACWNKGYMMFTNTYVLKDGLESNFAFKCNCKAANQFNNKKK